MAWLKGSLRWFAHHFGGVGRSGHVQSLRLLPNTHFSLLTLQKGQLCFLSFCIFWS